MPSETPRSFDPAAYLTEHRGRKYLEVRWRLLWLRVEHPDAQIETEEVASGDDWVKFRARVTIPGGGSATGHALQHRQDFPGGYLEKAETKAVGRALAFLGYGSQFATEFDEDADGTRQPAETPIEFPRSLPRPVRETPPPRPEQPSPTRTRSATTWSDFWKTIREHKAEHPEFDEGTALGKDVAKRMTAEEAMRRFREITGQG